MIAKLLDVRRLAHFKSHPKPHPEPPPAREPERTMTDAGPLRIVHAGGTVESYYMAIPAAKIMEKYPSLVLTRPEVFRRPWDSLVDPDEILTPGNKYYAVPLHTVRKLRRRIKRPARDTSIKSCMHKSVDTSFCKSSEGSGSRKEKVVKKHVKFADLEMKKNKAKKEQNNDRGFNTKETRSIVLWQPSLISINEGNSVYY